MNTLETKTEQSNCSKPSKRTKCEIWTRVMGYHRPTVNFNKGKVGEKQQRVCLKVK